VSALTIRFHPGPGATARTRRFFAELSSSSDVMVAPSALPRKKTAR